MHSLSKFTTCIDSLKVLKKFQGGRLNEDGDYCNYRKYVAGNIVENLRRFNIKYNEENAIVKTESKIPIYVKVIASIGPKFCYAVFKDEISQFDLFVCAESIQEKCLDPAEYYFTKKELGMLKNEVKSGQLPEQKYSFAQLYIKDLMIMTKRFLMKNKHIILVSTDKGGRVVIMEKSAYYQKMDEHIDDNLKAHNYFYCKELKFDDISKLVEQEYQDLISEFNPFLAKDVIDSRQNCCVQLRFEPFVVPMLYGNPKPQKEGIPMRPIVSSLNAIGSNLSFWLLRKLQKIAKHLSRYNTSGPVHIVNELKHLVMETDHKLVTWDFSSMFTNVPIYDSIAVIKKYYHMISSYTCLPLELFVKAIRFFTVVSTYFVYKGKIYRQCAGLAMGNCLSQVLAEITTNEALLDAVKEFTPESISFIYKFVDDIMAGMRKDDMKTLESKVSSRLRNMKMNRTDEDESNEVVFLGCKFKRMAESGSIVYKWFKQPYSSLQVLNFHSNHPRKIKINVIKELAKLALATTSPMFMNETIALLQTIFENSCYPSMTFGKVIDEQLKNVNEKCGSKLSVKSMEYVTCPYYLPFTSRVESILSENKSSINLGHRPITTN